MEPDTGDKLGPPPRRVRVRLWLGLPLTGICMYAFFSVIGTWYAIDSVKERGVGHLVHALVTDAFVVACLALVSQLLLRCRWLAKFGQVSQGRVTKKVKWMRALGFPYIELVFSGPDGVERKGRGFVHHRSWDSLEQGASVIVLFDPMNPMRHGAWLTISMWFRVKEAR